MKWIKHVILILVVSISTILGASVEVLGDGEYISADVIMGELNFQVNGKSVGEAGVIIYDDMVFAPLELVMCIPNKGVELNSDTGTVEIINDEGINNEKFIIENYLGVEEYETVNVEFSYFGANISYEGEYIYDSKMIFYDGHIYIMLGIVLELPGIYFEYNEVTDSFIIEYSQEAEVSEGIFDTDGVDYTEEELQEILRKKRILISMEVPVLPPLNYMDPNYSTKYMRYWQEYSSYLEKARELFVPTPYIPSSGFCDTLEEQGEKFSAFLVEQQNQRILVSLRPYELELDRLVEDDYRRKSGYFFSYKEREEFLRPYRERENDEYERKYGHLTLEERKRLQNMEYDALQQQLDEYTFRMDFYNDNGFFDINY